MSSEEENQSLSNEQSENDELNFKEDEDEESNKFKVPEKNSEKKSESLNFKEDEEKESNQFKVSNHSKSKKSNDNKSENEKSQSQKSKSEKSQSKKSESKNSQKKNDDNKSESQKSKSEKSESKKSESQKSKSEKSESKKSQSKKSENKNSEDKKSESIKSQSKKSENKNSEVKNSEDKKSEDKNQEDNKSESQKSQSQKSESQKSKSQKSKSQKSQSQNLQSKKSESHNSQSKKSSLPNIIDENKSEKSSKNKNYPLFNDILTGDPNDENLNLPPLSYNNKYIKTPSVISKNSSKKDSKKLKLNNENEEEKKSEYSKSSKFKKSKNSNYEEKQSYKSSKKKIINDETILKEPPHENSIIPYRIIINNENDKNKLNDLLCYKCQNFPLNPISCSECNTIFCKECIDENNKCLNCNSIFKKGEISDDIKNLYSNIKINCKYKECGCNEILSSNELLNHENNCKSKIGKCSFCNNEFKYEELYSHIKNCKNTERKCTICGYKDTYEEYNRTDKKIEHIKHILLPEITNIIQSEMNKFYKHLFEDKEQKKKLESKGEEQIDIMKTQGERIINMENLINEMNENIKKIQSSPAYNAVGLSIATNELKNKLKSIKLISNITTSIDNGFECDNKFCVIQTFSNDYIIVYPNLKYGIDIYNLSNNQIENVIKKAHDSNITCMSYSQNKKKNLTYLITASFDRSINIYSIEDGWKKIKNILEAHDDYSIFSLDSFYNEEKGIISISGNKNLSEVKIWFCDVEDKNKLIKLNNNKIFCIKHNPKNLDEIYIGTDEGILLFLISKITENENKPEKNLQDKNFDKSNHICISFLDNNEYNLIEGDSIGKIRIWSLNTNELIKIFERGILTFQINTLENWDDRFVIGGSRDGKIILFDVIDGVQVDEIGSHNGYVYCVKIATHWKYGKIIVSSGYDGVLKLWGSSENN